MDKRVQNYLLEGYLEENPVLTSRVFKRYTEADQQKLSFSLLLRSLQLVEKLSSRNKNIKVIDKSRGDITNYKGLPGIEKSLAGIVRMIPSSYPNKDLPKAIRILEQTLNILRKYRKQFKQGYRENDYLIKALYRALVAGLASGTLRLNTAYLIYDKENVAYTVSTSDLKVTNSSIFKSLEDLVDLDRQGDIERVFKLRKDPNTVNINEGIEHTTTDPLREFAYLEEEADMSWGEFFKSLGNIFFGDAGTGDEGVVTKIFKSPSVRKAVRFVTISLVVIVAARTIITNFYQWRVDIAGSLNETAEDIYSTLPTITDTETREKQTKIADKLTKLANKIDIEETNAERTATDSLEKLDKEVEKDYREDNISGDDLVLDF